MIQFPSFFFYSLFQFSIVSSSSPSQIQCNKINDPSRQKDHWLPTKPLDISSLSSFCDIHFFMKFNVYLILEIIWNVLVYILQVFQITLRYLLSPSNPQKTKIFPHLSHNQKLFAPIVALQINRELSGKKIRNVRNAKTFSTFMFAIYESIF